MQDVHLVRARGQTRSIARAPVSVSRESVDVKPEYNNLILLKSSVVEGERKGSSVARQHGGNDLSRIFRCLT